MKIEYMREMKRSYMTVKWEKEDKGGNYEAEMLEKNQIPGLLKMKVKYTDGDVVYCYDITSRQPISRLFESRPADERQVRSFFLQLYETLDRMEAYLLGDGGILIDPELIYVEPEGFKADFCVVPGRKEDFNSQLCQFIQYLMKHIDHKDRECVVLTYGLYQASMKDNYGLEELMEILAEKVLVSEKTEKVKEMAQEELKPEKENDVWEQEKESWNDVWEEADGESNREGRNHVWELVKKLLCIPLLLAAAAAGTWFLYGVDVLTQYWMYGAAAGGILAAGVTVSHFIFEKWGKNREFKAEETEKEDKKDPWRIYYEEPEKTWDTGEIEKDRVDDNKDKDSGWKKPEPEFQTVLLTAKEEPVHTLVSAVPENQDISVGYMPFVIGKHEGLADYILDKPAVSRFHVRITEKEGQCFLTDLNSTNGTKVNGRLLAANEEITLNEGDEVRIAEERYFWK